MKLSETAIELFAENKKLQEKAYNELVNICKENGNEFGFSSSTCIDVYLGCVVGLKSCTLKGMYIKDDQLYIEYITIYGDYEGDPLVDKHQSIEILEILQDATILGNEEDFLDEHPSLETVTEDNDLETA